MLPERVVVGMVDELLPELVVLRHHGLGLGQRDEVHVELPGVGLIGNEFGVPFPVGGALVLVAEGVGG